ncbi:MAG: 3-hydroxyacyl-CoA dehydrogenase [Gammaproteobacteria bacterium]
MTALASTAAIGVIGAGTMGAGIAQVAAAAGHRVFLYDAAPGAAVLAKQRITGALTRRVESARMDAGERDALLAHIQAVNQREELAPAKLIIEAVSEDLTLKRKVLREFESLCAPDTLFATNTSSLSVTAIGAALARPENLAGIHFFNPAPVMKLVEVVSGLATHPNVAKVIFATAERWGKQAVHARSTPGFIVNRIARPFYGEALRALEEGAADVATIDAVFRESGGFRMGPFELMDLIGIDVNFAVTSGVYKAFFDDPRYRPSLLQQELVDAGRFGRKSGRGFYEYGDKPERPEPKNTASAAPPASVSVCGNLGCAQGLAELIENAGIRVDAEAGPGRLRLGNTAIALTDGRSATRHAADERINELVLFDLALDYGEAKRIAISKADQASTESLIATAGLFQALGKHVSIVDDIPGLLVMRAVCMLANEAAHAVDQQVCSASDVDTAMQTGVNYPLGPLAWAQRIGLSSVLNAIDNLAAVYGQDRYRASPLLRRKVATGIGFEGL